MGARPNSQRWGASAADWDTFVHWFGLQEDLLPVVSNPTARIAPSSSLQALGKVPSRYNADGHVVGFAKWTDRRSSPSEITAWSKNPDYGICVQTRRLRALDIDIDDAPTVVRVMSIVRESLGTDVAVRYRENSAKVLVPVWVPGDLGKRRLVLPEGAGAIELLANGQQFIAVGTHPSGARYRWTAAEGGQPMALDAPPLDDLPTLEPDELEALWLRLRDAVAAQDNRVKPALERAVRLGEAAARDPVAMHLYDHGMVLDVGREGQLFVPCPNAGEHTAEGSPSATAYFPANTGGYQQGHWKCMHAHCEGRPDAFFTQLLMPIEFEDLSAEAQGYELEMGEAAGDGGGEGNAGRFTPVRLADFLAGADREAWLVKHLLPATGVATIFGESGAGKSFTVIDIACHVALGREWQQRRVAAGRVVYVAAEGAGGIRRRLQAWCAAHDTDAGAVDLHVVAARPNFLRGDEVSRLTRAIGSAALVVVDTAMAVTPGGDENSSEHMGTLMRFAARIADAVGGLVLLVHHAGKDVSRGQRGWSGLKGAVDTELEVTRNGDDRCLRLSKVRDGPLEGFRWHFRLEERVLGYDRDEDAITSAVVAWVEAPRKTPGRVLSALQQHVLTVVVDLVQLGGAVATDAVVEEAVRRIARAPGGKRDTRRQVVTASLNSLRSRGVVEIFDDTVRPV